MAVPPLGQTDPAAWRLDSSDHGRHVWHYIGSSHEAVWGDDPRLVKERPQSHEATYALGLPLPAVAGLLDPKGNPHDAASKGYEFYKRLQSPDGHFSGEYGGPLFLLPGIVIAMYVTATPIPEEWRIEISRYLANIQRTGGEDDCGWGIHIESKSSVFGTGLNYVVLRLLGVGPDVPMMIRARATLHILGGCTGIPSWGKFWLAILGVYDWSGQNPTPAELNLLPEWLPIHPHRWWIHTRNVATPMGYLSGRRFTAPLDALLLSLRSELYVENYNSIKWSSCRNKIAAVDLYSPHSALADGLFFIVNAYEKVAPSFLRTRALDRAYELVKMEDENTGYQTVGPVSKAMNMLCRFDREGRDSDAFKLHVDKIRDFMWMGKDGMMMTGTNGSQLWDVAFISQALVATSLGSLPSNHASSRALLEWLEDCQMQENPKYWKQSYRNATKGAWPFSTKEQGYTVSDCAAEGMKAVLALQSLPDMPELISYARLCDCVDVILGLQNPNGGFASYELIRGPAMLELINPAEVFGNIMIEYCYPECTTACLTALSVFKVKHPEYRAQDIQETTRKGIEYIRNAQRPDGSWYGSWGICFTYATMFALESLALEGETYANSDSVRRACDFLVSKQRADGGWGESYKEYVQHEESQVVNTSWAVLGLMHAEYPVLDVVRKGCKVVMARQQADGSWLQEGIEGVFNKNCAISYPNFKFSWTIWALGTAFKYCGKEGW